MKLFKMFIALTLTFALLLGSVACSTTWVTEAEQIVAALLPAVANILALATALDGPAMSSQDLATIQAWEAQVEPDLQLVGSLITQYNAATDAATQSSVLAKIQAALTVAQQNTNALLPALHVTDPATQAKIAAVVSLVLSEIDSLTAVVPLVHPNATVESMRVRLKAAKVKAPLSAKDFTKSFNLIMGAKTGNVSLNAHASRCKIHSSFGAGLGEYLFGGNR